MQRYTDIVTDKNGNAIRGAAVTVYDEDGAVATLYDNAAGTTSKANPLSTDTDGTFYFYAANGRYNLGVSVSGYATDTQSDILLFDPEDAGVISVRDFGAKGDGTTDDTAAFNLMTAALRAALVDTVDYDYAGYALTIPPGVYSVSSWDLTNLLTQNVHVNAHGAVIVARTADKNVVDCTGSRYIKFHGLMVYSSSSVVARSGVQLGPKGTEAIGNFSFNDVTLVGYFSGAPLMNLGAETTSHFNLRLIQRNTSASVYALIADGLSTYVPTSDYATVTRTPGQALSFTANGFTGCQIRNEGGGSAAYLGKTQGWSFDITTYWLSFNDSAAVVYGTGTYRTDKLTLRGSFESNQNNQPTVGNIGLRYAVTFDNDGTGTAIDGFAFESTNMHAETAVFRNAGAGAYRLSDADIRVHQIEQAACTLIGTGSISVDGMLMTQSAAKANLGALTAFNGIAWVDAYSSLASVPAAGSYSIHSRSDSTTRHGGSSDFPTFTFTPTVTFATPGDLSVSYAVQSGWGYRVGRLCFVQLALTFTPTYTTSSGEFRIAGLPSASPSAANQETALSIANLNSGWTWPAGTSSVTARLPNNATNLRLYGHGTGAASVAFTTAHVPSGTAKSVLLSGCYLEA